MQKLQARSSIQMKKKRKIKIATHTIIENIIQDIIQRMIRGIGRKEGAIWHNIHGLQEDY